MKTFTLGELAVMKYGKLPPKEILDSGCPIFTGYRVSGYAKECLYENPMLIVVARGVGGTGDVKLSPPRSWVTNLSIVLDLDETKADKQFLCYFLGQQSLKDKLNTGSAQAQITVNALSTFQVTIPSLRVQGRIASILSGYDDLIENNTRRITILEQMARRVYEEWFVRFRFPGHEGVRMVESELGLVPEGWHSCLLGDKIELPYGKALKAENRTEGVVPVYGSSGVIGSHASSLVDGPGIVVGRKGNVGSVHWSDVPFYPIDTVFYVRSVLPLHFVFFNLQQQNFLNNDAAVPGLNRNQAYSLPLLVPDEALLTKFEEICKGTLGLARLLMRENTNLRTTRDLLLPKLISGELDVSELAEPESIAA